MADRSPPVRLGDGVVLGLGPKATMLIDLKADREIKIADPGYAAALEQLAFGADVSAWADLLPRMLADGLAAEGPLGADPILRERLTRMDRMVGTDVLDGASPRVQRAYQLTVDAHAWRKRFFSQVGQCPTLPETTLRRALLVGDAEQVGALELLCVGDDDFVSVPLAALGHRVTVLDIDPFLISLLDRMRVEMGLAISVQEKNLLAPLAPTDLGRFDGFVTDPMSNRDCFNIFVSRALAMTRAGGRGFVAVYGPAGRLFDEVAREMHLPVRAWHARHNRYYSQYMKLHSYESDWVEVARAPELRLAVPAEVEASAPNLYAEAYFQRKPTFCAFYDEIEDVHHAKPLFLDMVLDMVEGAGLALGARTIHPGEGWSVLHAPTDEGHLTLHADRERRQISVEIYPARVALEDALRHTLLAGYKPNARTARMSNDRDVWDLRVR